MNNTQIKETGYQNTTKDKEKAQILYLDTENKGAIKPELILEKITFNEEKVRTGEKGGFEFEEILSRFGDISIDTALKILKATNMTFELFKKVASYAFENISENNKKRSINVYLKDISNKNFVSYVENLEEQHKINTSKIIFEVLENNYGDLNFVAINNLKLLQEKGYNIAIDDFTLSIEEDNLSQDILDVLIKNDLIPDYVKIDGNFLQEVLNGNTSEKEIKNFKNILKYIKSRGITIVGEWIQSNKDGLKARELGIDLFQGRYINDNFCLKEEVIRNFKLISNNNSFRLKKAPLDPSFTLDNTTRSFTLYKGGQVNNILSYGN